MIASASTSFRRADAGPSRLRGLARAAGVGAATGVIGAAGMLLTEKLEQGITRRPNSYVPGRALLTLFGRRPSDRSKPVVANQLMHFGTGALLGALRGIWAVTGIRGLSANVWHATVRLAFDQTVENSTGVGAPPARWPAVERLLDVGHKTAFSLITGLLLDRLVQPTLTSDRGRTSH